MGKIMSKFKIKFKLQGLELEIEGNKDDVPLIMEGVGQQISGLLQPAASMVGDTSKADETNASMQPVTIIDATPKKKTQKRRQSNIQNSTQTAQSDSINFHHKSDIYGNPKQTWKTSQKAMWIIYVLNKENNIQSLSSEQITNIFNKHFKQAKTIIKNNVTRDLCKAKITKSGSQSLVGEDVNSYPSEWYLTEEGIKYVENMIQDQKSES